MLYFEDKADLKDLPDSIQEHLKANRKVLKERATVKNEGRIWWRWSRPMHKEYYHLPKIWCSYRSKDNEFVLDESNDTIGLSNMTVIFGTNAILSLKYLLAILNSSLFKWRYNSIGKQTGGGIFEYMPNGVGKFPIPSLDLSNSQDKVTHDTLVALVDKMLVLKQNEHDEPNSQIKTLLQRQIDAVDTQINDVVYKIYELTDEEVKIIKQEETFCR